MTDSSDGNFLFCVNHPRVPTLLRCNKCNRPVCARCLVLTPVGYRCKDCVRGQQRVYENVVGTDYLLAGGVAAPVALLGSVGAVLGVCVVGFAPVIGLLAAEAVRLAIRGRRGQWLGLAATGGFVIGSLPALIWPVVQTGLTGLQGSGAVDLTVLLGVVWALLYLVSGAAVVYIRLKNWIF